MDVKPPWPSRSRPVRPYAHRTAPRVAAYAVIGAKHSPLKKGRDHQSLERAKEASIRDLTKRYQKFAIWP